MRFMNNNSHLKPLRLPLISIGIVFFLLACSLTSHISFMVTATPGSTATYLSQNRPVKKNTTQPSPTPLPSQAKTDAVPTTPVPGKNADCYLGSWHPTNIDAFVKPILQQNKIKNIQFTGSTGSMDLEFTQDGKLILTVQQYDSQFSGVYGFFPVTVDVLLDGDGAGDYAIDNSGSILLSNPDFGGINYSAKAGAIEAIKPSPITDLLPVLRANPGGRPTNLSSTCSVDDLTIASGNPSLPPVLFSRIK